MPLPEILEQWLNGVRPEHRDLLVGLHRILMDVQPDLAMTLKWRNPAYVLDGKLFFYLAGQREYVQLGLYNGAQFKDAHDLIEGTGKRLRHIKIAELDDQLRAALRDTVEASLAAGSDYKG